ncbi:hypothetical protein LCGC14_2856100, partial [marine sediment metagenome]
MRYVYTGNVSDREHQGTRCPGCDRVVIGRDGYTLGTFDVEAGRCRHCNTPIAGHYDKTPGTWGGKRLPVKIGDYAMAEKPAQKPEAKIPPATAEAKPTPRPKPAAAAGERPELTDQQQQRIFQAAGRRVAAAVRGEQAESLDTVRAAVRAAKEDPRFPPISPTELQHLDMEVWLLWGLMPVTELGEDRVGAVVIGKHGLQIARGNARGLLLPGVAVDHNLDARGFLQQVCVKAGLPVDAWKQDDTSLMTFEGHAVSGPLSTTLDDQVVAEIEATPAGGPTPSEMATLAQFCRGNI